MVQSILLVTLPEYKMGSANIRTHKHIRTNTQTQRNEMFGSYPTCIPIYPEYSSFVLLSLMIKSFKNIVALCWSLYTDDDTTHTHMPNQFVIYSIVNAGFPIPDSRIARLPQQLFFVLFIRISVYACVRSIRYDVIAIRSPS